MPSPNSVVANQSHGAAAAAYASTPRRSPHNAFHSAATTARTELITVTSPNIIASNRRGTAAVSARSLPLYGESILRTPQATSISSRSQNLYPGSDENKQITAQLKQMPVFRDAGKDQDSDLEDDV